MTTSDKILEKIEKYRNSDKKYSSEEVLADMIELLKLQEQRLKGVA